jgi:hypothetical protein
VLIAFDAPLPQPTEWQHTGNQINSTMIFVQFTLHKFERRKPAFQSQAHFQLLVSRPRNQNDSGALLENAGGADGKGAQDRRG